MERKNIEKHKTCHWLREQNAKGGKGINPLQLAVDDPEAKGIEIDQYVNLLRVYPCLTKRIEPMMYKNREFWQSVLGIGWMWHDVADLGD